MSDNIKFYVLLVKQVNGHQIRKITPDIGEVVEYVILHAQQFYGVKNEEAQARVSDWLLSSDSFAADTTSTHDIYKVVCHDVEPTSCTIEDAVVTFTYNFDLI